MFQPVSGWLRFRLPGQESGLTPLPHFQRKTVETAYRSTLAALILCPRLDGRQWEVDGWQGETAVGWGGTKPADWAQKSVEVLFFCKTSVPDTTLATAGTRTHRSPSVTILIVPSQRTCVGTKIQFLRNGNPPPIKTIVVPTVLEFFPDAVTHLEFEIRGHGYVARVE